MYSCSGGKHPNRKSWDVVSLLMLKNCDAEKTDGILYTSFFCRHTILPTTKMNIMLKDSLHMQYALNCRWY